MRTLNLDEDAMKKLEGKTVFAVIDYNHPRRIEGKILSKSKREELFGPSRVVTEGILKKDVHGFYVFEKHEYSGMLNPVYPSTWGNNYKRKRIGHVTLAELGENGISRVYESRW